MSDIQELQADILVDLQLQLEQESFIVSKEAVEIFKQLGIEIQRLPLENALFHGSPMVRGVAAKLLGRLKDHRAVHNLSKCRSDEDPWVRAMIYEALGQFSGVEISDLIAEGLNDPEWKVRGIAVQVIAPYRHEKSKNQLVTMLESDSAEEVKAACARALSFFEDDDLTSILAKSMHSALPRTRAMSIKALGTKSPNPEVAEQLLPFLKDPHAWVRSSAAWCLGVWDSLPAVEHLKNLLDDPEIKVQEAATHALGLILNQRHKNDEHSGSLDALRQHLNNQWCRILKENKPDQNFTIVLLESISKVRYGLSERQLELITRLSYEEDKEIRFRAIKCLCNCAGWESRVHLLEVLQEETEEAPIRSGILDLLSNSSRFQDDETSVSLFSEVAKKWLESENAWLVGGAMLAASNLKLNELGPQIIGHLNHHHPDVRGRACKVIAELKVEGALKALIYTLREDSEPIVRYAAATSLLEFAKLEEAQDALMYALNDDDTSVQIACSQTLCKAGFGRTIKTLQRVLKGTELPLKLATAKSLVYFNHPDWIPWIKDNVEDEENELVRKALLESLKVIQKGFQDTKEL